MFELFQYSCCFHSRLLFWSASLDRNTCVCIFLQGHIQVKTNQIKRTESCQNPVTTKPSVGIIAEKAFQFVKASLSFNIPTIPSIWNLPSIFSPIRAFLNPLTGRGHHSSYWQNRTERKAGMCAQPTGTLGASVPTQSLKRIKTHGCKKLQIEPIPIVLWNSQHLSKIEGLLEVLFKKIEDFSLSVLALQIL